MQFKTGDLVVIKNVGIEHLRKYKDMCGEIISWIKIKGEFKYKVKLYYVDDFETAYFKENELEPLENMKVGESNI